MPTLLSQQRMDRVRRTRPDLLALYMQRHGDRSVLILSKEHDAYWHQSGAGYTKGINAGRFGLYQAWRMTSHCGPEKKIFYELI